MIYSDDQMKQMFQNWRPPDIEANSETPVRSSEWLDRAIAWVEYSAHKPWCNVAPGNIYAGDGDPCDCGRDTVLKDLNAARSNNDSASSH